MKGEESDPSVGNGGVRHGPGAEEGAMDEDRPGEVGEQPPARFQRFERVEVTDTAGKLHQGTILWRDLCQYTAFPDRDGQEPPRRWSQWEYAVDLTDFACCPTFDESRLAATGEFDPEVAHRGRRHEISFDTGLEGDNSTVEGSYRIPGEFWQVFLFEKENAPGESVPELRHQFGAWASGMTGITFEVPREAVVDKGYIFRAFSSVFGTENWVEVRGPDSLLMK
jgi:hypothetical protein